MKRAVLVLVLGLGLVGFSPGPAAEAAVSRHWGQAINNFNARLLACKAPVRSKQGFRWRINLRAVNSGRVKVVASAKVNGGRNNHPTVTASWARTVQPGASTPVSHVFAWEKFHRTRIYRTVTLSVRRVRDGQQLTWPRIQPRDIPSCALAPRTLNWRGALPNFSSSGGGRMQLCANLFLDAKGERVRWRFRGDARRAERPLSYQAKVSRVSDGQVLRHWSRTIPPGGYTPAGALMQSTTIDPSTNSAVEGLDLGVLEPGDSFPGWTSGRSPLNIC